MFHRDSRLWSKVIKVTIVYHRVYFYVLSFNYITLMMILFCLAKQMLSLSISKMKPTKYSKNKINKMPVLKFYENKNNKRYSCELNNNKTTEFDHIH